MPSLRIGLIGWGTVGSALGELIESGPLPLELASVAVRDRARERGRSLPEGVRIGLPGEVDAVVELAGGVDAPLAWARETLQRGVAYVTANKALLATHGEELSRLARVNGGALLGSASVGGGTPMIEMVQHLAATGAIESLSGIVNATTTYILSAMGEGRSYADALRAAQEAGYAEADPAFDVEGRDAAQKLAILASLAWGRWRGESEVDSSGIVGVAVRPGDTIRLVAEATREQMSVAPMQLEPSSPLARVAGVESILEVVVAGAAFRISGPGAGGRVTAGAVYGDLARLVAGERPILFGGAS